MSTDKSYQYHRSLGCGIGYGYLHRIPLRTGNEVHTTEKVPLLTEQKSEEKPAIPVSEPNPLELGAAPTIPTLPTSSATTLQVTSADLY